MICVPYTIAPSRIPGAGQGLFLTAPVAAGRVITAPTGIDRTLPLADVLASTDPAISDSSIRWFEEHCTASPDWPDECYINHSHAPSGLWHLGFVFAAGLLDAGTEITFDYGHIIAPGYTLAWRDAVSGRPITGYDWADSLRRSLAALTAVLGPPRQLAPSASRAG